MGLDLRLLGCCVVLSIVVVAYAGVAVEDDCTPPRFSLALSLRHVLR